MLAKVLAVRSLFSASEVTWRVPMLFLASLGGMALGAWLVGVIYDRAGYYAVAWQVGIVFDLLQLAIMVFLLSRQPTPGL